MHETIESTGIDEHRIDEHRIDEIIAPKARMPHPAFLLEGAMDALQAMNRAVASADVPPVILHLVTLRASQINGCSWCTVEHAAELRGDGSSETRIAAVAAWREAPYFTARERAALALTEALTRCADRPDPVPDELWAEVTALFSKRQVAALLLEIGAINVWNRLNAAIRQPAGQR
ncbi:carboxymuconolactone decarboxylase family protein [Microbacterium rhizosphaerae]|uniref:Carboxymuconolactone decarboxylase family protein n=1 Tax=Microbacterium rhizosphaerae TaxID=1678237 RepID=A0ABZ0SMS1_9MICO|nr:carboxymuconolactone decarboxylase family protein [Microbacterium rhizosphaerae]WPR88982.1 carboxymuconolactone decarboxylase family protein [Microbacterium rhizosphaerae]